MISMSWKGGRVVEGTGLENRQGVHAPSWVRIPPLPPCCSNAFRKSLKMLNGKVVFGFEIHFSRSSRDALQMSVSAPYFSVAFFRKPKGLKGLQGTAPRARTTHRIA